jgi:hypothetical protein
MTTVNQILVAAKRLSQSDRERLILRLLASRKAQPLVKPTAEEIRQAVKANQASPRDRRRLSALLRKGNAGTLTPNERAELDRLVDDCERRTLAVAVDLTRTVNR